MIERNATKRLKGDVQLDDAYIGGSRSGKSGRGAAGKTPFVAAVSVTSDGKPDRIVLRRVARFSKIAIAGFARAALEAGAHQALQCACTALVRPAGEAPFLSWPRVGSTRLAVRAHG
jgi:hypothetical protein